MEQGEGEGLSKRGDAERLRLATGPVFAVRHCMTALASCDQDMQQAAEWLAAGKWRDGLMISWDHESLRTKSDAMHAATGTRWEECLSFLMNCCGNVEMATRKLQGLSALAMAEPPEGTGKEGRA